ncbi:hypothetical protein LMG28688_05307 [Paraburkholderia caffeinitolerans]|uniref:Transposase IS66 C-terminal domain-containing protein n=1 Tax=Paraburkholderia caffeinitolerans TaxID=1723730 RepID=A0A6J5GJC4_9BURK|nr:hypothetical protein LMG28688_05307 [Paraburkholderia caffeinitolerans]
MTRHNRRIRPFVVGRKGWLFADTVAGAQASANLYSLVESCKANGIDPYRYLVWLFTKLPLAVTADDYAALMRRGPCPDNLIVDSRVKSRNHCL